MRDDEADDTDTRPVLPDDLVVLEGDGSLDGAGEAVTEVEAEGCVSRIALEGTDVSLSTEFRLEKLVSKPGVLLLFAMVMVADLSGDVSDCWLLMVRDL